MRDLNYVPLYVLEYISYISTGMDHNIEHRIQMSSLFGDLLQYF